MWRPVPDGMPAAETGDHKGRPYSVMHAPTASSRFVGAALVAARPDGMHEAETGDHKRRPYAFTARGNG